MVKRAKESIKGVFQTFGFFGFHLHGKKYNGTSKNIGAVRLGAIRGPKERRISVRVRCVLVKDRWIGAFSDVIKKKLR